MKILKGIVFSLLVGLTTIGLTQAAELPEVQDCYWMTLIDGSAALVCSFKK